MLRPSSLRDSGPTREELARDGFERDFPWMLLGGLLLGLWLLGLSFERAFFSAFGLRRADLGFAWGEPLSRGLEMLTDWRIGLGALLVATLGALLMAGRRRSRATGGVMMSVGGLLILLAAALAGGTWLGRDQARRIEAGTPGAAPAVQCELLSSAVTGNGGVSDALSDATAEAPLRLLARSASVYAILPPGGGAEEGPGGVLLLPSARVSGCRLTGEGTASLNLLTDPPLYWRS